MAAKTKASGADGDYAWAMSGNYVLCFKSVFGGQDVAKLWETTQLSEFHDVELARATKEINAILGKLEKSNGDPDRKLSLIRFRNRHLLVWARYGTVAEGDDDAEIIKALKLRVK